MDLLNDTLIICSHISIDFRKEVRVNFEFWFIVFLFLFLLLSVSFLIWLHFDLTCLNWRILYFLKLIGQRLIVLRYQILVSRIRIGLEIFK